MNAGTLRRVLFGLMLIGFGLLFLASQLGFIENDWGDILSTLWPVFIIFLGLSGMLSSGRNASGLFWNGFVVLVGFVFLFRNLGVMWLDFGDLVKMAIPAFIILYGLKLILGGSGRKSDPPPPPAGGKAPDDPHDFAPPPPPPPPPPSVFDEPAGPGADKSSGDAGPAGGGRPNPGAGWHAGPGDPSGGPAGSGTGPAGRSAASGGWDGTWHDDRDGIETKNGFIGDLYVGRDYWQLKPMAVNMFIGDTVIDLTKAHIPYGETKVTVSAFIGDVKVLVPADSDVSFKVNSSSFIGDIRVFGRRTGGFFRSIDEQLPDYADADRKIFLQCNLFIGDIQIMRVG